MVVVQPRLQCIHENQKASLSAMGAVAGLDRDEVVSPLCLEQDVRQVRVADKVNNAPPYSKESRICGKLVAFTEISRIFLCQTT